MKSFRSTLTLILFGALTVVACTPSDEQINPLTGTWTLKAVSCQNCIDKAQIASTTYSCNDSGCNTITFSQDGALQQIETLGADSKIISGTYSISGNTVRFNMNDQNFASKVYSYTLSDSMLYLKEIVDEGSGKCGATTVLAK